MTRSRNGLAVSLAALLLGSAAPAAFAQPAYASTGAIARPAPIAAPIGGGVIDRVRDAVRGWLIHQAVALTNNGTAIITNRWIQAGTAAKNIGWGTGTGAAAVGNTAMGTEVAPTSTVGRTVGTESRTTITNANDNYQVTGLITATLAGPTAMTEAGLFDSATAGAGTMMLRGVHSAVNVSAGDSINYTIGVQILANVV